MNLETGTDHNRSQALSDAAIRRSLLGCADASEQAKFEMFLMLDEQFEKRVYRLELELTDDFSFGGLDEAEEQLCKARFLVTRSRLRELAVSQALVQSASKRESQKEEIGSHWRPAFLNVLMADHSLAGHAVAATSVVLLGFLFWLSLKVPNPRPPLNTKPLPQPQASRTLASTEKQFSHAVATQTSNVASSESNSNPQPSVRSEPLRANTDSSSTQLIQTTKADTSIRFELTVTDGDHQTYRAILLTEGGQEVMAFSDLRATTEQPARIVVNVPLESLMDGGYYISLTQMTTDIGKSPQTFSFHLKRE